MVVLVSRTPKDSTVHGPLAWGKGTKQRAYGYEFWGRRSALCGLREPGKYTKTQTHRAERRQAKNEIQDELKDCA